MSQVEPGGVRRSNRDSKKTPKQKQLDEEKAMRDEQGEERTLEKQSQSKAKQRRAEERTHVETLQAQAQAELKNADATVSMMYGMGEVPGLDSNDPNYELIRKIAHLTGHNYAGQGLTTEELQEVLDDPTADSPLGESDKSTKNGLATHQPDFALYYPGITFGGNLDTNPAPKPTPIPSKLTHPAPTDSDTATPKRRRISNDSYSSPHTAKAVHNSNGSKGSLAPPTSTRHNSPATRTDTTSFHDDTPTRPDWPPQPPRRKTTPLLPTNTTIIGGTPRRPVKVRSGLKIQHGHSQPLPNHTRPTKPVPAQRVSEAERPTSSSASASPLNRQHTNREPSPEDDSLLSHPPSPTSSTPTPRKTDGLSSREPTPPPPKAKDKARAQSTGGIAERPTAHNSKNPTSKPLSQLRAEQEGVSNKIRTEMAIWQSRFHEVVKGQPLPPALDAVAGRIQELRSRYRILAQQISDSPKQKSPPTSNTKNANAARTTVSSSATATSSHPNNTSRTLSTTTATTSAPRKSFNSGSAVSPRGGLGTRERPSDNLPKKHTSRRSAGESSDGGDNHDDNRNHNRNRNRNGNGNGGGSTDSDGNGDGDGDGGARNNNPDDDDLGDGLGPDDDSEGERKDVQALGKRSEKEIQNKPNLSDFPHEDAHVLTVAGQYALAALLARGIFKYRPTDAGPKLNHEEYVYKGAWRSACLELAANRPYRSIFGKWMSQRRSGFINYSAKLLRPVVDDHFGFTRDNPHRNISIHKTAAGRGFHMGNGLAFQSLCLRRAIRTLVFDPSHPYGIRCPDLYSPIPSRVIAYVCAILQFIINNYRKGPWNNDRMNATTQGAFFRQFLREYEQEENTNQDTIVWGTDYRQRMYTRGRILYEAGKPVEDPMPRAEGTWTSNMDVESD